MTSKETLAPRVVRTLDEPMLYIGGLPLRLSFEPDAIREHFERSDRIQQLTDEQLVEIGEAALLNDATYRVFNQALRDAVQAQHGFDPDLEPQDDA